MKQPEYIPYGAEWRKEMERNRKTDVIRIASEALMQKESERTQMIDALMKCYKMGDRVLHDEELEIKHWIETMPAIERALLDAGVEGL